MGITGSPLTPGDQGPHEGRDRPGPAEPPPDNWNAEFTAIVSGISGSMRWEVTGDDLDRGAAEQPATRRHTFDTAPESIWADAEPDTAQDRKLRRELRRQERAEALAAHLEAEAQREAAHAADTDHFVPPEPPPLPRPRRRTVGAIILVAVGILLLVWPTLLPVSSELIFVVALVLIIAGGAVLVTGIHHRRPRRDGWDDGAEV